MIAHLRNIMARNRRALEQDLQSSWRRRLVSPVGFGLYAELIPLLRQQSGRVVLDAGCGTMPFRHALERPNGTYHTLDHEERAAGVTFLGDIQTMKDVPSDTYDTVLCSEVLEHVPRPDMALAAIHRVLKPGGLLVLTVPFLSRLHEEPHDYYRYTAHGLRYLLAQQGFIVDRIQPHGSVLSFVGHQVSTAVVSGCYGIPVLRQVAFWLNAIGVVLPCYALDRLFGTRRLLPSGYVVLARRAP